MTVSELHKACGAMIVKGHGSCEVYLDVRIEEREITYWSVLDTEEWSSEVKELNHLHIRAGEFIGDRRERN